MSDSDSMNRHGHSPGRFWDRFTVAGLSSENICVDGETVGRLTETGGRGDKHGMPGVEGCGPSLLVLLCCLLTISLPHPALWCGVP